MITLIRLRAFVLSSVACLLVACSAHDAGPALSEQDIADNNRGVGLMGYFDYEGARQIFAQLAQRHPLWHDVQVNLAIATLNRQQQGDEQTALDLVMQVLLANPEHLRARYVAGLLRLNAGDSAMALADFEHVARADPDDPYAAYYSALCRAQLGDAERALADYRRAIELDPYLRSAYYGAFQALQRLKRREEAREMLAQFQRLADNPQARLAEFKYTRMGDKGAAQVVNLQAPAEIQQPEGELFVAARPMADLPPLVGAQETAMTVADANGDGVLDLYIAQTANGSLLVTGGADGTFTMQAQHALSGIANVRAALWGDVDNDGLLDAYLLRDGPNQLWQQVAQGEWRDVSETSASSGGDTDSIDGAMFDADHDGDLDIFVINADAPVELFNNNLDGTFRPLAKTQDLARSGRRARSVVVTDLDHDRDTDILVVYASPPHDVFLNDRLWAYRSAQDMALFSQASLAAAVAGDVDADGSAEIYAIAEDGALLRFTRAASHAWQQESLAPAGTASAAGIAQLALADLDGDGRQELIYSIDEGWQVGRLDGEGFEPGFTGKLGSHGHWLLANLELPAGPSIIGAVNDGPPLIWKPGRGRHAFIGLSFTGLEEKAESMRSNASGIGTRVDLRIDSRWRSHDTLRNHTGPGQSLQPLFVGAGGYESIDYVALTWSDGVFQTELGLRPGTLHKITETQRQLSSCPVLFAWDGEKFAFVSDLLGVGGIGFNTGFGQYATPRPWEFFLLPQNSVRDHAGSIELKIAEPMEEVAYIDTARLRAYSLPAGWQMVLDERMGLSEPLPSGRAIFYRTESLPVSARNDRDADVLAALMAADGSAAPVGERDRRFIGRLAEQHVLELEFPAPLNDEQRIPWLVVDGWVEYPYSQTGFAAWQAGAAFEAPSLAAGNAAGEWVEIAHQFGYPAGMPRRMAFPLDKLPAATTRLRLATNLEVYWDRISVVFEEPAPDELQVEELTLLKAVLEAPGFPLRKDGPQRRPDYDFDRRTPLWDTRHPKGHYTAFGDATELVAANDDALAIVGPGEALSLTFAAPTRAGGQTHLVLEARGWAKDMDLYTNSGGTVGPLPALGLDPTRREALHERYNTRFEAGY